MPGSDWPGLVSFRHSSEPCQSWGHQEMCGDERSAGGTVLAGLSVLHTCFGRSVPAVERFELGRQFYIHALGGVCQRWNGLSWVVSSATCFGRSVPAVEQFELDRQFCGMFWLKCAIGGTDWAGSSVLHTCFGRSVPLVERFWLGRQFYIHALGGVCHRWNSLSWVVSFAACFG
jgi:hypothetical protein